MLLAVTSQTFIVFPRNSTNRTNDLLAMLASYISSSFFLLVPILNYVVPISTAVKPPFFSHVSARSLNDLIGTDRACQLSSRHVWKT